MSPPGFVRFYRLWTRVRAKAFTALCRGDFSRIGRHSTLQPPVQLQGVEHIAIGTRAFLGPHCWLEVLDRHEPRSVPTITIGDGVSITGYCTITAKQSVIIEANVLIARYVYISDHSHAHAAPDRPIKAQGIAGIAPVRIREGAWLGQSVVICPGVTIGRNAVIGANSVVRQNIPDFCVAVGAPARVVRYPTPTAV